MERLSFRRLTAAEKKNARPAGLAGRAWEKIDQERMTASMLFLGLSSLLAHPPLPLQEFLPAQPLSPELQLPAPLQEFWPLQLCLPASDFVWSEVPRLAVAA